MGETLLPRPFCGDAGEKGHQEVTQMHNNNKFTRITCDTCGAMCPEENWNSRATPAEPLLYQNNDGRSAVAVPGAAFLSDPGWHRVGPVD